MNIASYISTPVYKLCGYILHVTASTLVGNIVWINIAQYIYLSFGEHYVCANCKVHLDSRRKHYVDVYCKVNLDLLW